MIHGTVMIAVTSIAILFALTFPSFRKNYIINCTFLIYIGAVLSITIFPIPIDSEYIHFQRGLAEYEHPYNNTEFFSSIFRTLSYGGVEGIFREIGGNLLLLFPLGFFLPLVFNQQRYTVVCVIGFLSSLLIEAMQWGISRYAGFVIRVADVDDLLLNTAGVIVGFFLWILIQKHRRSIQTN